MVRQTLLVVAPDCDEQLLYLAGTTVRYAWQGIRTVLIVIDEGKRSDSQTLMARVGTLLGAGQQFQWQAESTLSHRLARTLRAFQPQTVLTTTSALTPTQEAWNIATDETIRMPGLGMFHPTAGRLWTPQGDDATIEVPLTGGIRHAIACLFAEGRYSVSEMRQLVSQWEWSSFETFAWVGGAPLLDREQKPVSDFFGITSD